MKCFLKRIRVSLAASCMLLAACGRPPSIEFETSGNVTIVHLETLAEYPTVIDRIVITKEDHPEDIIFEARSDDDAEIRRFVIHTGSNDVGAIRPDQGTYRKLIPNGNSFLLLPNESYRITICRAGKCRSNHFTFK